MKIRIEKRGADKHGRQSLRLIYDMGRRGSNPQYRKKEALDLFVYKNPKTPIERQHNKDTLTLAEAIRAKKVIQVQQGKFDLGDASNLKRSFYKWFEGITESKLEGSKSNHSVYVSVFKHLQKFHGEPDLIFEQITPEFLDAFKAYLVTQPLTKSGQKLSTNTAHSYFNKICSAINEAHRRGVLRENPLISVKRIKAENTQREYLSLEELKAMAQAECRYPVLKRAFLFSCTTGLRWSDVHKLTWGMVQHFNGGSRITFNHQKNNTLQYLDLGDQAVQLMGDRSEATDRVFHGLKYSSEANVALLQWALKAGITKHITFHSARHTFAVTQLSMGVDIYTVSKLLGHSEVKTTQIYADIIEQRRMDTMRQFPQIL